MSKALDTHDTGSPRLPGLAERQRLLHDTVQGTDQELSHRLRTLLEKADELFFELSSRATSNTEQNCYFEAMRELRAKGQDVLTGFRAARQQQLQRAEQAGTATDSTGAAPRGDNRPLELVNPEELEQNVAVAGMTAKLRAGQGGLIQALGYRLGWLVNAPLDARNNPLDPQQICQAFVQALQPLPLHIKARLVLLKQFDQQVLPALPALLAAADQRLQAAGFVPDPPAAEQAPQRRRPAGRGGLSGLSETLDALRALGISIPSAPRTAHISRPTSQGHTPIASSDLLADIARLQGLDTYKPQGGAREIRAVVQQVLANRNRTGQPAVLAPVDENIINLVALFFDYVLDDPALPTCTKLLISRLQLQVLKAALHNPAFFDDPDHPARSFIECLAQAGIGCRDDAPEDPLYKALSTAVQAVLADPHGSEATFEREADRIFDIAAHEQRKAALIEKRTSESAQGQARARHARRLVQQTLFQTLRDLYLPEPVLNFLVTTWRDVMFQVFLKFGQDSREWRAAGTVVNDLVDCASAARRPTDHPQLPQRATDLLARIGRLSDQAATATALTSSTFHALQALCRHWQMGESGDATPVPLSPLHAEALGESLANTLGSWDQEIAQQQEVEKYASLSFDALRQADLLEPGTWIARQDPAHPDREQRCKLAAKIVETDSYIFVDAHGFRLLELPRRSVAHELQRGRLRALDDGPLFERAFDAISDRMRRLAGEISPGH